MLIFQIRPVVCAAILCAGLAAARADDTPAQAAARAALLEKMNAQETSPAQPSQPAPVTVTPAGAAMEPTTPPVTNAMSSAAANDDAKAEQAAATAKAKADAQQAAAELKTKKLAEKKAARQKAADEAAAKAQAKAKAKADKAAAKAKAKAEAQQAAAELKAKQEAEAAAQAQAAAKPATETWVTPAPVASPAPVATEEEMAPVKPAKKKKAAATPPATSSPPAWAAGDNEAQAKARAALLEKMNEIAAEPAPSVPTPAPIIVTPAGATVEQPAQPAVGTAPAQPAVGAAMTAPAQPTKPVVEKKKKKKKKVAPETAAFATQPGQPAATSFPGKELGMQPIVAPPLPITATKEDQLQALLAKYMADQISPEEYHKQRAAILDQP